MQENSFRTLTRSLGSARLLSYRKANESELDAVARYVWNVRLCEALYPAFHFLEVALRNRLHDTIARVTGDELWLSSAPLLPYERDAVEKACHELSSKGKSTDSNRIIAELQFGFWTGLLSSRYEPIFWRRPQGLFRAFPGLPNTSRPLNVLSGRYTSVRHFRNRVFHHEPIWKDSQLLHKHDELIEAISWICPVTSRLTQATDEFAAVHHPDSLQELKKYLDSRI